MAPSNSLSLPYVILTITLAFYSFRAFASSSIKVPEPIGPTDPTVVKIARFAVAEQNRQPKASKLEFVSVIKADILVVAGLSYRLVIAAKDSGAKSANYLAIVHDGGDNTLKLVSFKKTT